MATATTDIDSTKIKFTVLREIQWSEFRDLSTKKVKKFFVTAHNVVYFWSIVLKKKTANKFGLYLYYYDGPLATIEEAHSKISFLPADDRDFEIKALEIPTRNFSQDGYGWGCFNLEKDADAFQRKYNLVGSRCLICQISLFIPKSAFSFTYGIPAPIPTSQWIVDLFKVIDDVEKSKFHNARLVSRDGCTFYCHRLMLEGQSPVFEAMFRHPPGKDQMKDTYPFPTMGSESLKALLEFLYTGRVVLKDLSTAAIMETADSAEQYGLQSLMESCRAVLWDRVVDNVADCIDIIQFSDLHEENLKYVKHRGFEILAKNYSNIVQAGNKNLSQRFGGGKRGENLAHEYNLFVTRRVQGYFSN